LWEILIKLPKDAKLIQQCKTQIQSQIGLLQNNKTYRSMHVVVDIDPN